MLYVPNRSVGDDWVKLLMVRSLAWVGALTVDVRLVRLFVSFRSAMALFGSTRAVLVSVAAALGARTSIHMFAESSIARIPPVHVTTPLACVHMKPWSLVNAWYATPAGRVSETTTLRAVPPMVTGSQFGRWTAHAS